MELNTRSIVTVDGITDTIREHAKRRGIKADTLYYRLKQMKTDDPARILQSAAAARTSKPVPPPTREEVITHLLRTPAGRLATAKRLGDYASIHYGAA